MLWALLMATASLQAVAREPSAESSVADVFEQPITVTGLSLQATATALERCLARACPPEEDIAASLAHAENQLIAGELQDARATLLRSRSRNSRYAARLPVPVGTLLHFNAEVASLLGLADPARVGTIDAVSALKKGLPADDPRIAAQKLRVADVFLREGRYETAVKMYDAVADRAEASGWPTLRGIAMFRGLIFYAMAARHNPVFAGQARRRYAALRSTKDPSMQTVRDATELLEARLILLTDENADVDTVFAGMQGVRTTDPMLVVDPAVELEDILPPVVTSAIARDMWVDVAFTITPGGRVEDVEVEPRSAAVAERFVERVRTAVAGRRYLPLDREPGSPGLSRRERYMVVVDFKPQIRSRIPVQAGRPRLHRIDLTRRQTAPAEPTSSTVQN